MTGRPSSRAGFLGRLPAVLAGAIAAFALAPAAAAGGTPALVLNEVNCTGTDWIEVVNHGDAEASIANWLLTDDPLDRVPLRASHRWRFAADATLAQGASVVVSAGATGFPFGLSCGDDTLRLADAADTPVDSFTLPVLADGSMTLGRIPDGTGDWTVTLPTPGTANAVAGSPENQDPAWLYDLLLVHQIDLEATDAALAELDAAPTEYVEARLTLHDGATTYGPYVVGLRLKGHTSFRPLSGKAAFKVKFGFGVSGQRFFGLKGLTLNNMVQDPSMISEATTSLLVAATGAPAQRVGYAYVRLNGTDYGLYTNVENIDAVMAQRWASGTRHVYEADLGGEDAIPGGAGAFEVDEGSSTDLSDLEALAAANAGGAAGWWERMQPVANLTEMTRVWAAEHYAGHWDGYSIADPSIRNYYLHSDPAGLFTLVTSGTDQTWLERPGFGVYGSGALMRACAVDDTCMRLYVDALRQLEASPAVAALPAEARAIRAAIAPWRARDPRREQTVADGEAQADAKLATIDARTGELAAWLESLYGAAAEEPPAVDSGAQATPVDTAPVPSPSPLPAAVPRSPLARAAPLVIRPVLGKAVATPAKPVHGRRFTFSLTVTRSDTGKPLTAGKMDCSPSVAGKPIRHTDSFEAGKAKLSLVVPSSAKGRLLKVKVTVTVTATGHAATHTYVYAVR